MGAATAVKIRFYAPLILIIAAMTAPCSITSVDAKTYRWTDENGQVHYSDNLPPQEVDRAYSIMNREGVTVDNVEKAKTKEQLEEEARLQQQQKEQERLARERATYDHILLDTYPQVSDLEDTRDRYIATIEGLIKVAQHKLGNLTRDLEKFQQSAAKLERDGKPVGKVLSKDIANLQTQVEAENNFIKAQRAQQQELREKFAADIKRFKELKGLQQSNNK